MMKTWELNQVKSQGRVKKKMQFVGMENGLVLIRIVSQGRKPSNKDYIKGIRITAHQFLKVSEQYAKWWKNKHKKKGKTK